MIRNTIRLLFVILSLACWIKPVKLSGCPCKTTSSSEDVIDNHVLKGHVISSLKVNDVGQCFHDCVHDNKCKSFNIGKENNALLCELNESDKNLSPRSLQQNEGWTYYEVNERLPSEVKLPSFIVDDLFTDKFWYINQYTYVSTNTLTYPTLSADSSKIYLDNVQKHYLPNINSQLLVNKVVN